MKSVKMLACAASVLVVASLVSVLYPAKARTEGTPGNYPTTIVS